MGEFWQLKEGSEDHVEFIGFDTQGQENWHAHVERGGRIELTQIIGWSKPPHFVLDPDSLAWLGELDRLAKAHFGTLVDPAEKAKAEQKGMRICLGGMISNACRAMGPSGSARGEAFSLRELHKHLEELRADPSRVHEFFALYVE